MIDGTDEKRIKIVKELIESIDKDVKNKIPVVFLVNKQDLPNAINKNQMKEFIDIDKLDSNFIWTIKYNFSFMLGTVLDLLITG